jgi:hypothetical protein
MSMMTLNKDEVVMRASKNLTKFLYHLDIVRTSNEAHIGHSYTENLQDNVSN